MNPQVFLLLGTNLGDRLTNLTSAKQEISRQVGEIITQSAIYKSQAWGNTNQPEFYNQVIQLSTNSTPQDVLSTILTIEQKIGRIREEKWGPRIIDIDILLWSTLTIETPTLTIPHPGIAVRRFTLQPLNEIASDFIHPVLGKTIEQLLKECQDKLLVEKIS